MSVSAPTILILDDSDEFLLLYREILDGEGYRSMTAECAQDAVDLLAAGEKPALILVDCVMPAPGPEPFLEALEKRYPDVRGAAKLVGFSLLHPSASPLQALRPRLDAYLQKPDDLDEFLRAIADFLKS